MFHSNLTLHMSKLFSLIFRFLLFPTSFFLSDLLEISLFNPPPYSFNNLLVLSGYNHFSFLGLLLLALGLLSSQFWTTLTAP